MKPTALASNPEFKRNLWLTFSTHRLIAMPALLGLIFLAVALSNKQTDVAEKLYATAVGLFIFIVWLWGSRNANAAIVDELRDKTWDQQRMSALNPWTMTWGKLFGATAFNWYGGFICLAVIALTSFAEGKPIFTLPLTLIAVGIMLHASLITTNLHASKTESRIIQRGGFGWIVIVLALIFLPQLILSSHDERFIVWWLASIEYETFFLYSALLFAGCATFSAWRVMCGALEVRTLPWAWPLFACILAVYFTGFYATADTHALFLGGLIIAAWMSYTAIFSEPTDLLVWRKLQLRQQTKNLRGWLEQLPLWPTTLLMTFIFALLATLTPSQTNLGEPLFTHVEPFTLALMVLRDACIVLFFTFSPKAKRALGAAILYLMVINALLPFLMYAAKLDAVAYFFLPLDYKHDSWNGLLIMTIHTFIAMGLVKWRLDKLKAN